MGIKLGSIDITGVKIGNQEVTKVYVGSEQIRPTGPDKDYLCFTAEEANSTIQLTKTGSPTEVILEISTDGTNWSTYTIGDIITLTNVGDKVYWRSKLETMRSFNKLSDRYTFAISGKVGCSGDIGYLLCKNSTDTLPNQYCFYRLFYSCTGLTTTPELPATTLTQGCYDQMFYGCTALTTITSLPATTLLTSCYYQMFYGCSSIKLSATQDSDYTQPYRIPTEGTGTSAGASNWNSGMFLHTGGSHTSAPAINTTYYLHKDNTIV